MATSCYLKVACLHKFQKHSCLFYPVFVTCINNMGEGLVNLIMCWSLGGHVEEWHIPSKFVSALPIATTDLGMRLPKHSKLQQKINTINTSINLRSTPFFDISIAIINECCTLNLSNTQTNSCCSYIQY